MLSKLFKVDPEVLEIIKSLRENPSAWIVDEHWLFLNKLNEEYKFFFEYTGLMAGFMSTLSIWIANGPSYMRINNHRAWNMVSRKVLWKAFKQWEKTQKPNDKMLKHIIETCKQTDAKAPAQEKSLEKIIPIRKDILIH